MTGSQEFSKQVLARLHGMARIRICKKRGCPTCKELPRERPTAPTAENNILLAMRAERIRQELLRTSLQTVVSPPSVVAVPDTSAPMEPARTLHRLPAAEGFAWAAVGNLMNHAFASDVSVCGKWPRDKARFNWVGYHYCKACREGM